MALPDTMLKLNDKLDLIIQNQNRLILLHRHQLKRLKLINNNIKQSNRKPSEETIIEEFNKVMVLIGEE